MTRKARTPHLLMVSNNPTFDNGDIWYYLRSKVLYMGGKIFMNFQVIYGGVLRMKLNSIYVNHQTT